MKAVVSKIGRRLWYAKTYYDCREFEMFGKTEQEAVDRLSDTMKKYLEDSEKTYYVYRPQAGKFVPENEPYPL